MVQSAVIHQDFEYTGHNAVLHTVCFNPQDASFVSGDDTSLRLWRPVRNGDVRQINLPPRTSQYIQALTFIESRQMYVASALDGTLRLYDVELNELTSIFTGRAVIVSLVFDSKHQRLFTGGIDGCAVWQLRGKASLNPENVLNPSYEIAALPNFFHYAEKILGKPTEEVGESEKAEKSTGKAPKKRFVRPNDIAWVQSVQLNSEQTRLYAQGKYQIDVFSTVDGHHVDTYAQLYPREYGAITAFVVHEKTQYIVCGSVSGALFVLSVCPISLIHIFKDHTTAVTGLAVHGSSGLILSSSMDGTVRLWDLDARRQTHRLDVRQPVHAMGILVPSANPYEFYCRVRSSVQIFSIRSAAKEHLASLTPTSILQRVVTPTAATIYAPEVLLGEREDTKDNSLFKLAALRSKDERAHDAELEHQLQQMQTPTQWIVAAGMDRTIRVFSGRAAHEAPSFTWIPEETTLNVIGFSLHPKGTRLFLLLESQKLVLVEVVKLEDDDQNEERPRAPVTQIIDLDPCNGPFKLSGKSCETGNKSPSIRSQKKERDTSTSSSTPASASTTTIMRGAIRSLCCCHYPPIFRASMASSSVVSTPSAYAPALTSDAAHARWFSRTFVHRRQQTKRELKRLDSSLSTNSSSSPEKPQETASPSSPSSQRPPLVQSEREWVVCGSEYGHLVFWHAGLGPSFADAISLDAHDAAIVAIQAGASSALLVSLDAAKRVHLWQLQPVFNLRQMLELHESPTCWVLSPTSELLVSGYEDGTVVLMNVSDALSASHQVETFTGDEHHFAMISAADFLDEKQLVLTASVDAVIKVWDHQKNLLRQIQLGMALTSLCFMNQDGDVMAGVATGILVIPRADILPEKLPETNHSTAKKLPFWLEAAESNGSATMEPREPSQPTRPIGFLKKRVSVTFRDDSEDRRGFQADQNDAVNALKASEASNPESPEPSESLLPPMSPSNSWERKKDALVASIPLNKPIAELHPPVLRPISNRQPRLHLNQRPPSSSLRSPSSSFVRKDQDWRDVIMPSPYRLPTRDSPRHARTRSSAAAQTIAELRMLAHTSHLHPPRSPRRDSSCNVEDSPASPLAIGRAEGDPVPLQYCKHQAPVPHKAKTPRKLWNAIGGEDRRLLAVQRNLPSI
ncbi:hypothetical protein Poli38472_011466 [Pythium oligandrum]|uniref:WD40 repeat-like protein n=1 Tax=Pythium oligandrum TaxID=41045 RepID=A0A8K1CKV5_PYTOL|nr:hypothetical protein Poli38472_011466 [Pythium oligandrum]|eukprot:TMW64586.1 hypothetical protein Poli38472_011466 [Pythium oligandrum]